MLTPKVATGALAGSVTIVIVWILGKFHVDVDVAVAQAMTVIISTASSYFAPRSEPTAEDVTKILTTNAMQQNLNTPK